MKDFRFLMFGFTLPVLSSALPLHAQGGAVLNGPADNGCAESPENPTAILAVVGSAGAFFVSAHTRINARHNAK